MNAARLVGPSIAGILIASVGEGMCFLLNAVSYVAVIAALMAMTIHRNCSSLAVFPAHPSCSPRIHMTIVHRSHEKNSLDSEPYMSDIIKQTIDKLTLSTPFEIRGLLSPDEITMSKKFKKLQYWLLNVGSSDERSIGKERNSRWGGYINY
jgi:hypothetical protein